MAVKIRNRQWRNRKARCFGEKEEHKSKVRGPNKTENQTSIKITENWIKSKSLTKQNTACSLNKYVNIKEEPSALDSVPQSGLSLVVETHQSPSTRKGSQEGDSMWNYYPKQVQNILK